MSDAEPRTPHRARSDHHPAMDRDMRLRELRLAVDSGRYDIDPHRVAEALLRRIDLRAPYAVAPPVIRPRARDREAAADRPDR